MTAVAKTGPEPLVGSRPARRVPRFGLSRLHVLVATVIAAGAGCLLVAAILPGSTVLHGGIVRMLLTVAIVAVSEAAVLHLRFGNDNCTLTWAEAAILIGLTVSPWPWIVIASPIGILVTQVCARRDPLKIAFNAASTAVGAGLASVCVYAVAGTVRPAHVVDLRFDLALVCAALVFFLWNTFSVTAVIAAARQVPISGIIHEGLALKFGLLAGNTAIALLLIDVPWRGSAVVLIPFCIVLLFITYRGYHRALEDGDVWRQLDDAGKELSRLDMTGVAHAAVARAAALFSAESAELAVSYDWLNSARVFRYESDGTSSVRSEQLAVVQAAHDTAPNAAGKVETVLRTGVGDSAAVLGVLRLRLPDATRLSERQQRVLRTFGHTVAASLQNARLYSEMQYQAHVNAHEAAHDPLTGIANRKVLNGTAGVEIARAAQSGNAVGLLLVDLDHFKEINDTIGHHAGDAVLCAVAQRLSAATPASDLVARLGGDEFAILLGNLPDASLAEKIGERLLGVIAEPVEYEGLRLAVAGSIGIACYPHDGLTAEDLLRKADMAMYQAKQARGAVSRYSPDRDDHTLGRITLAAELQLAIRNREFLLQYQPQVDLLTGRLVGAEALARWRHPTRGLLGPGDFIELVERSGLIREFAVTTLDLAIADAAAWYRRGLRMPVSVNLSARNLLDVNLPDDVARILARHELPPELLVLELTETAMIVDADAVEAVLSRLRQQGVQLSVDDFGTGYSSLAFLQRVAVNEIKIDRSFVLMMTSSDSDAAIVRATIELAHGLGIRVVAEGVETAEHVAALTALKCDIAQGWHFGRPGTASAIEDLAAVSVCGA